uniref:U-box domain-containing protein n=1 Tax=Panagrellus redivivus TaxID=6233 RepID=A0A7E4V0W6_PANRE
MTPPEGYIFDKESVLNYISPIRRTCTTSRRRSLIIPARLSTRRGKIAKSNSNKKLAYNQRHHVSDAELKSSQLVERYIQTTFADGPSSKTASRSVSNIAGDKMNLFIDFWRPVLLEKIQKGNIQNDACPAPSHQEIRRQAQQQDDQEAFRQEARQARYHRDESR